ncbi:MAG: hypothetical protein ACAH11_14320 [Sphingomonas sp.]
MTQGLILDTNQSGAHAVSSWIEGAPDRGWLGLKLRGRTKYEILTWRCGRCGFLEGYAK